MIPFYGIRPCVLKADVLMYATGSQPKTWRPVRENPPYSALKECILTNYYISR